MPLPDDLTPLLIPSRSAPAPVSGLRIGTVLTYDPATGANTVNVGGGTLTNLALLNTSDVINYSPGDTVVIMTMGPSWAILGRCDVPGGNILHSARHRPARPTPQAHSRCPRGRTRPRSA
jgi:hypothetical protein